MAISSTDRAIATVALNRAPNLSHAARRVGLELLNHVNKASGLAWPSEIRLASILGISKRTIARAKAELRAAGLLTWQQRGRHRTPIYRLAWEALQGIAASIRAKVDKAKAFHRNSTRQDAPQPIAKPQPDRARTGLGLPNVAAYLSHSLDIAMGGRWKTPGTPPKQILTDAQLDGKASARLWDALSRLGPQVITQLLDHPQADRIQAEAIKAERYRPSGTPDGKAGILKLQRLLEQGANAW